MIKSIQLFIILSILCLQFHEATAQSYKSVELKPIYKQGWKYYYDFRKVNSPSALQIPLQSLNDEEVNVRFRRYSTMQSLRGIGYFASVIYLISGSSSIQGSGEVFLGILAASVIADITLSITSHHQMKKAIQRYNLLIINKKIGAGIQPGQQLIGLGFTRKF